MATKPQDVEAQRSVLFDSRQGDSSMYDDEDEEDDAAENLSFVPQQNESPVASRSHYHLSKPEIVKGLANRIVHSRAYIFLYLGMAALSITTVVLSLLGDCPPLAFYVLEVIINVAMVGEVAIRMVALGWKNFQSSWFNVVDGVLTVLCTITLLVVFLSSCENGSKEEEVLDTLLLVARNLMQFVRLAGVMRRSGTSIFRRPPPIDLSSARQAAFALDLDLDDEEALAEHQLTAQSSSTRMGSYSRVNAEDTAPTRAPLQVGPTKGRENLTQDDEDQWDRLG